MRHPLLYALVADLLTALEADGSPPGTDLHLRIQALLRCLPEDADPEDLKTLLGPVLCKNKAEQERFYFLFDASWKRVQEVGILEKSIENETIEKREDKKKTKLKRWGWLAGGVFVLCIGLWVRKYLTEENKSKNLYETRTYLNIPAGEEREYGFDTLLDKQNGAHFALEYLPADTAAVGVRVDTIAHRLHYRGIEAGTDSASLRIRRGQGKERLHKVIFNVTDTAGAAIPPVATAATPQDCLYVQRPLRSRDLAGLLPPQTTQFQQFLLNNEWPLKATAVLLSGLLLWLLARWAERRRRKLIAEHQPNSKPPYTWNIRPEGEPELAFGERYYDLLNMLRRREGDEHWRLDMPQTIRATVRKGGMPEFCFAQQTRPAEYLLLLDTRSARDHRAQLFNLLYKNFRAQEIIVERYYYDGDPRLCWNENHPKGLTLRELQYQFPQSRLLLVGDSYQLLNPQTGRIAKWANLFATWNDRAVLSPQPVYDWGRRERALREQFYVLPAALSGLHEAVERFDADDHKESDISPRNFPDAHYEPIQLIDNDLIKTLHTAYGDDGHATAMLSWIAACAVYPELHWDLTLYFGNLLSADEEPLLNAGNIAELCRLPWFTDGKMPDEARKVLLAWLEEQQPATLLRVREHLHKLLKNNPPPADSAAYDDYAMNLALNEWLFTKDKRRRQELEEEIATRFAAGQEADFTVVKVLDRPRSPLDFVVPDAWRKFVYHRGSPLLGWRVWMWALPLWLILSGLALWWQPEQVECTGETIQYKNREWCLENLDELQIFWETAALDALEENNLAAADSFTRLLVIFNCKINRLLQPGELRGLYIGSDYSFNEDPSWSEIRQATIVSLSNRFSVMTRSGYQFPNEGPAPQPAIIPSSLDSTAVLQRLSTAYFNKGVAWWQRYENEIKDESLPGAGPRARVLKDSACYFFTYAGELNVLLPDTSQLWYIRKAFQTCIPQSVAVQDIVLRGQIQDAETKRLIPQSVFSKTVVSAKGLANGYLLSKGQFRVDVPGEWRSPVVITVTAPGYLAQTITVQPADFQRNVVVPLTPELIRVAVADTTRQGKWEQPQELSPESQRMSTLIDSIFHIAGVPNIKIKVLVNNDVQSVRATEIRGEKYIIYNSLFINKLPDWSYLGVLVHEIGHLALGHDFNQNDATKRREIELQTDQFMGKILARMGASREEALSAFNLVENRQSTFFPPVDARIQAAATAFDSEREKQVQSQSAGFFEGEKQKITDTDGDGVPDAEDNCPKIKGLKERKGCPAGNLFREHTVAEGESLRSIATRYGMDVQQLAVANGMEINDRPMAGKIVLIPVSVAPADTDGDGVPDSEDKCPNEKGSPKSQGCPDNANSSGAVTQFAIPSDSKSNSARNVVATVDDEKIVFVFDIPLTRSLDKYDIELKVNSKLIVPMSITGTGKGLEQDLQREIIWYYTKDGYSKQQVVPQTGLYEVIATRIRK